MVIIAIVSYPTESATEMGKRFGATPSTCIHDLERTIFPRRSRGRY